MKNLIITTIASASILSSCGVNQNVSSNRSIQKRKYNKGLFVTKRAKINSSKATQKQVEINDEKVEPIEFTYSNNTSVLSEETHATLAQKTTSEEQKTTVQESKSLVDIEDDFTNNSPSDNIELSETESVIQIKTIENQLEKEEEVELDISGHSTAAIIMGALKILAGIALIICAIVFWEIIFIPFAVFHLVTGMAVLTLGILTRIHSIKVYRRSNN